jgi:hypothetical protein
MPLAGELKGKNECFSRSGILCSLCRYPQWQKMQPLALDTCVVWCGFPENTMQVGNPLNLCVKHLHLLAFSAAFKGQNIPHTK